MSALDRAKQLSGRCQGTGRHRRRPARDAALAGRTWVLISGSPDGGWGITGQASTSAGAAVVNWPGTERPGPLRHRIARAGCPQEPRIRTGSA